MLKTGFHRVRLAHYTGFRSSPYTEGALFYGEKLVDATARDAIVSQAVELTDLQRENSCEPGSA
jgi:hypothetical protein